MAGQGLSLLPILAALFTLVVISGIVVRLSPPPEIRPSRTRWKGLDPTRRSTKRLRDGTRITTSVYHSPDTGRAYTKTTRSTTL